MTAVDRSVPAERDGDVTVAVSASADVANLASQSKDAARTQRVGRGCAAAEVRSFRGEMQKRSSPRTHSFE